MKIALAAVAAVFACAPAAATVYNLSIELGTGNNQVAFTEPPFFADLTLNAGDSVDLAVTFKDGATLVMPEHFRPYLRTNVGLVDPAASAITTNWTLDFTNPSGPSPFPSSGTSVGPSPSVVVANFGFRLDTAFSFTGFHEVLTLADGPSVRTRYFQIDVGSVPEPATWAMMIAGFGLAGASVRRARADAPRSRRLGTQ